MVGKYRDDYDRKAGQARAHKKYRLKNPDKYKALYRKYNFLRYGITEDQYKILVEIQNKQCAICGREKKLFIDHDHTTGRIRGLLCAGCNLSLGHFEKMNNQKTFDYLRITQE